MRIKSIIANEFLYYGQEANAVQINLWADELISYAPEEVKEAYLRLRNSKTRVPLPVEVKEVLLGYIASDEAWGILPTSEADSVVWNEPIRIAYGAVRFMLAQDPIAARMAFKRTYEALIQERLFRNEKAQWDLSEGTDKRHKEQVLQDAVKRGWIKRNAALDWHPSIALAEPKILQIEAAEDVFTPEVALENIQKIKELLSRKKAENEIQEESKS